MKQNYKKIIGGLLLGSVFLGASVFSYVTSSPEAMLSFKDFTAGTKVEYKILADGQVIDRNTQSVDQDGNLKVLLPEKVASGKDITLDMNISSPETVNGQAARDLDLLLSLNKEDGGLQVQGTGFPEFSDIDLKRGDDHTNLSADWAGILSSGLQGGEQKGQNPIEIAFQKSGVAGDLEELGDGRLEVFLGDNSGSNINRVRQRYNWAIRKSTEELSAVMVMQTKIIGMFFDASIQLDTQRKHQELMARAHKDYHPSEQMCRVGTFIRSVAHTESKSELNKHAINKALMMEYIALEDTAAQGGPGVSENIETEHYVDHYCGPKDSSGATAGICTPDGSLSTQERNEKINKDIDFTRTIGTKLTLDIDFTEADGTNDISEDERAILTMAKHLYFPRSFNQPTQSEVNKDTRPHMESRSYAAKMAVAHTSFVEIVGMKASAPPGVDRTNGAVTASSPTPVQYGSATTLTRTDPPAFDEDAGWAYMKALLREFGLADTAGGVSVEDQIDDILGVRPSYYAQMEVLTKKIYQSPNFYTNLYDKPANVTRIGTSMDAILLMNQRDRFESALRREMLGAVLLETELIPHVEGIDAKIYEEVQKPQFEE